MILSPRETKNSSGDPPHGKKAQKKLVRRSSPLEKARNKLLRRLSPKDSSGESPPPERDQKKLIRQLSPLNKAQKKLVRRFSLTKSKEAKAHLAMPTPWKKIRKNSPGDSPPLEGTQRKLVWRCTPRKKVRKARPIFPSKNLSIFHCGQGFSQKLARRFSPP